MSRHERILVDGPDGKIEVFVENHDNPQGIALIAHPHPLFGGTADNKVVTTLARAFRERERAWPKYGAAIAWEKEHLQQLLRR